MVSHSLACNEPNAGSCSTTTCGCWCHKEAIVAPTTPTKPKVAIERWQYDEMELTLAATKSFYFAEKHMADHYTLTGPSRACVDIPLKYLIFGYKQDAVKWRMENDVAIKDTVVAKDWKKLEGLQCRVKPIYANREWYRLNRYHDIVRGAQAELYEHERRYGHVL